MPQARVALNSLLVGLPERPTVARFMDFWLAHHAWAHHRANLRQRVGAHHRSGPGVFG